MTAQTPIFGLKYPVVGEPIKTTRQILEDNAKSVEAALAGRVVVPDVSTLAAEVGARSAADTALSNRVTVLEPGGWTTLQLAAAFSAYTASGAYPVPAYRIEGHRVFMRGWLTNAGAVAALGPITSTPLNLAARPIGTSATLTAFTDTSAAKRLELQTSGNLLTYVALAAGTYLNLELCTWGLA